MCYVDLEPAELWTERERKARVAHRCDCCRGTIKPGDVYLIHFSVYEGTPNSEKMCLPCKADRAEFAAAHDGALCAPSYVRIMVRDCIGDGDNDEQWRALLGRIQARRAGDPAPTRPTDGEVQRSSAAGGAPDDHGGRGRPGADEPPAAAATGEPATGGGRGGDPAGGG